MRIQLIALSTVLFSFTNPTAAEPRYRLTDLGTLGGLNSRAYGVNNAGLVVGMSYTADSRTRAFLWDGQHMIDLGAFAAENSTEARGVSDGVDALTIVGFNLQVAGSELRTVSQAVRWDVLLDDQAPPVIAQTALPSLPGSYAIAEAINDSEQIVGAARTMDGVFHAVLWDGDTLTDLGKIGGTQIGPQLSWAHDINSAGEIVGIRQAKNGRWRAVYWHGQSTRALGSREQVSEALGINDDGAICGLGWNRNGMSVAAALWIDDHKIRLGQLDHGPQAQAKAINAHGDVVGQSSTTGRFVKRFGGGILAGEFRAFVALAEDDYDMRDLNQHIGNREQWIIIDAQDINDLGQIVGCARRTGDVAEHAVLLTRVQ